MSGPETQKLIVKFLTNEITSEDFDLLSNWIANPQNEALFESYVKIHYEVTLAMNKPDVDSIKKRLLKKIKRDKNPFYRYKLESLLKYAAVGVLFLGVGYLYQTGFFEFDKEVFVPSENAVTLQLGDGKVKVLSEDGGSMVIDTSGNTVVTQDGSQLAYNNEGDTEELVYNTLTVPYGKRFDILLSDGTKAYLNSGSSLRYPVSFLKGEDRQVYLTGEAFLEVFEDGEHPFIVNANELNIRVLGTRFNVSTYPEDETTEVVLVEGSVGLYSEGENFDTETNTILSPGLKGSYDKTDMSISTQMVITSVYTSWINGELVFRNMTFDNILKKLERHYNVSIINENRELSNERFNASFHNQPVEKVLEYFEGTHEIEISIGNNIITIK